MPQRIRISLPLIFLIFLCQSCYLTKGDKYAYLKFKTPCSNLLKINYSENTQFFVRKVVITPNPTNNLIPMFNSNRNANIGRKDKLIEISYLLIDTTTNSVLLIECLPYRAWNFYNKYHYLKDSIVDLKNANSFYIGTIKSNNQLIEFKNYNPNCDTSTTWQLERFQDDSLEIKAVKYQPLNDIFEIPFRFYRRNNFSLTYKGQLLDNALTMDVFEPEKKSLFKRKCNRIFLCFKPSCPQLYKVAFKESRIRNFKCFDIK